MRALSGIYVIVIGDIIDLGNNNSLKDFMPMLEERKCFLRYMYMYLFDKPKEERVEVDVKYNGFNILMNLLFGWQIDYEFES